MQTKPNFTYLLGTTCTGKDYLADTLCNFQPDYYGAIQVGREMRKRHPPEFFQGLGAMDSTESEVAEIFNDQLKHHISNQKKHIIVVGQPRLPKQVSTSLQKYPGNIILCHCDEATLAVRINARSNKADQELSKARIINDKIQFHDTFAHILTICPHTPITSFDSSINEFLPQKFQQLIQAFPSFATSQEITTESIIALGFSRITVLFSSIMYRLTKENYTFSLTFRPNYSTHLLSITSNQTKLGTGRVQFTVTNLNELKAFLKQDQIT